MYVEILTPEKKIFSQEAIAVQFPGTAGSFEVLRNHAPLVSSLAKGTIKITASDNKMHSVKIRRGFVEVFNNKISVLVEIEEQ